MVSVGDVFGVPLGKKVGLCRVVAEEKPRGTWDTERRWRVVTCEWVGPRAKVASALKSQLSPLKLTRLRGQPHVQSIGGPPPPEFKRVGERAPSAADRALKSPKSPGAWQWVETQLQAELDYRAAPRAFKAKWAAQVAKQKQARATERKTLRSKRAARPTTLAARNEKALAKLGAEKFSTWPQGGFVASVRKEVKSLARALRASHRVGVVVAAVSKTTRALNRLDAKWENAVTTPDAEELVEVLVGLAVAAGLDGAFAADLVDEVRAF